MFVVNTVSIFCYIKEWFEVFTYNLSFLRQVTIFGADSGASLALSLLAASPKAGWGPLFSSAWLVGPSSVLNRSFSQVSTPLNKILAYVRVHGVDDGTRGVQCSL